MPDQADKLGSLWKKQSTKASYMTGEVKIDGKKIRLIVFQNNRKTKETQPDFDIFIARRQTSDYRPDAQIAKENPSFTPVSQDYTMDDKRAEKAKEHLQDLRDSGNWQDQEIPF